jgi:hypothetical protein
MYLRLSYCFGAVSNCYTPTASILLDILVMSPPDVELFVSLSILAMPTAEEGRTMLEGKQEHEQEHEKLEPKEPSTKKQRKCNSSNEEATSMLASVGGLSLHSVNSTAEDKNNSSQDLSDGESTDEQESDNSISLLSHKHNK